MLYTQMSHIYCITLRYRRKRERACCNLWAIGLIIITSVSTGFSSVFIGFHWFFISFYWFPPDFHRFPLVSTGFSSISIGFHWFFIGFHWFPLVFHRFLLVSTGFSSVSTGFHRFPNVSTGFSSVSTGFHRFPLVSTGFPLVSHFSINDKVSLIFFLLKQFCVFHENYFNTFLELSLNARKELFGNGSEHKAKAYHLDTKGK